MPWEEEEINQCCIVSFSLRAAGRARKISDVLVCYCREQPGVMFMCKGLWSMRIQLNYSWDFCRAYLRNSGPHHSVLSQISVDAAAKSQSYSKLRCPSHLHWRCQRSVMHADWRWDGSGMHGLIFLIQTCVEVLRMKNWCSGYLCFCEDSGWQSDSNL